MNRITRASLLSGIFICLTLLASACDQQEPVTQTEPTNYEIRRYALASAIVDYEVRGLKSGRERLYFDHWGARQARYIHTEMRVLGIPQEEHELTISDGKWIYTIDLPAETGVREESPLLTRYASRLESTGTLTLGDELMEDIGGYKAGNNKILGRTCQIWLVPETHSQYCLWNNIPLLTIIRRRGVELITEAVRIDEHVSVRNDIFTIPDNVVITDQEK